jgi:hypothetical protein
VVAFVEKFNEYLQALGFLAEIAGGTDQFFQLRQRCAANAADGKESSFAEIGEGALDVGPGGILGEVGAHDHFERRLTGPPVLGSPSLVEGLEIVANVIVGLQDFHRFRLTESRTSASVTSFLHRRSWSLAWQFHATTAILARNLKEPTLEGSHRVQYKYLSYFFRIPVGVTICVSARSFR